MNTTLTIENYINIKDIPVWMNQRNLDDKLVDSIVDDQKLYYNQFGAFLLPSAIIIVTYNQNNYVVDGQHRMKAMNILYNLYKLISK
jgi:hypothetical protein